MRCWGCIWYLAVARLAGGRISNTTVRSGILFLCLQRNATQRQRQRVAIAVACVHHIYNLHTPDTHHPPRQKRPALCVGLAFHRSAQPAFRIVSHLFSGIILNCSTTRVIKGASADRATLLPPHIRLLYSTPLSHTHTHIAGRYPHNPPFARRLYSYTRTAPPRSTRRSHTHTHAHRNCVYLDFNRPSTLRTAEALLSCYLRPARPRRAATRSRPIALRRLHRFLPTSLLARHTHPRFISSRLAARGGSLSLPHNRVSPPYRARHAS